MELFFDKIDGVVLMILGYIGGFEKNLIYKQVVYGCIGYMEVFQIIYDLVKVSYEQLFEVFWCNYDLLIDDCQFCDCGQQYCFGIFFYDDVQKVVVVVLKNCIFDFGCFF